jgi:hypothetical protein
MAKRKQLEFFLLRYVPDAVKGEFVNIGVVMLEPGIAGGFADVRLTTDWRRARCLDPQVDVEMLESLAGEIRKDLGNAENQAALLKRMQDSYSNLIQLSPTIGCEAENPAVELEATASLYLKSERAVGERESKGRRKIFETMRDSFERAGVLAFVLPVPAAPYTRSGDPFRFDFGYRHESVLKLFHAVSLKNSVDSALTLAARYPRIVPGITKVVGDLPVLTAVVDDDLDRKRDDVQFALGMMEEERIRIAVAAEMPLIADVARVELRV